MSLLHQHYLMLAIIGVLAVVFVFTIDGWFGVLFVMVGGLFNVGLIGYREIMAKKDARA